MRNLYQNARPVAGLRIAAAGATMRQIDQDFDAFADNLVGFLAAKVHDEPHAAGIVLVLGMV